MYKITVLDEYAKLIVLTGIITARQPMHNQGFTYVLEREHSLTNVQEHVDAY